MPNVKKILRPGRNCIALKQVDSVSVLIDGRDYYRAFYSVARQARNYILISGWEFDSSVSLLRGKDLKENGEDIRFLDFLNTLCDENPDLRIYILAWNFSFIFLLEREWMQKKIFSRANPRIFFNFDSRHAFAASHHQKFIVVDGYAAFVGGMDICSNRWDDRSHLAKNPHRVDHGKSYGPYHDVNSYITGPVVEDLIETFKGRWLNSTGEKMDLPVHSHAIRITEETGIAVAASHAAISRTEARSLARLLNPVREIRSLYIDAIRNSRSLIYIENQYFSSYAIYRALVERMRSPASRLQIVIVLPKKERTFVENIYVGIAQARLLRSLKRVARKKGHSVGIYYPVVRSVEGQETPVFIHSKIMIVDDSFMTIGSANANNRSMGLDTELNVSWEAERQVQNGLADSIKRVRVELISEHLGIDPKIFLSRIAATDGLVDNLESAADSPTGRIRRHAPHKNFFTSRALRILRLDRILVDPERAVIDESIIAVASKARETFFKRIFDYLRKWVSK